MIQLNPKPSNA